MLTDSILMGSAALLGVDSVTGIWKNKRDINKNMKFIIKPF